MPAQLRVTLGGRGGSLTWVLSALWACAARTSVPVWLCLCQSVSVFVSLCLCQSVPTSLCLVSLGEQQPLPHQLPGQRRVLFQAQPCVAVSGRAGMERYRAPSGPGPAHLRPSRSAEAPLIPPTAARAAGRCAPPPHGASHGAVTVLLPSRLRPAPREQGTAAPVPARSPALPSSLPALPHRPLARAPGPQARARVTSPPSNQPPPLPAPRSAPLGPGGPARGRGGGARAAVSPAEPGKDAPSRAVRAGPSGTRPVRSGGGHGAG